jgi:hypothetical protein
MKKITIILLSICLTNIALSQGVLVPTNGPVKTMKTLQQIEPRIDILTIPGNTDNHHIITEPGSYYLSGNLVVTKKVGISIQATNVTINLYGFVISRFLSNEGNAIVIKPGQDNAVIKNGTIRSFLYGIYSEPSPRYAENCRFEDLTICYSMMSTTNSSALYAGNNSIISGCRIYNNSSCGIIAQNNAIISSCIINNNNKDGINTGDNSIISNCIVYENNNGIRAGVSTRISSSVVYTNYNSISTGSESSLSECTVLNNTSRGIFAGSKSTISKCTSYMNFGKHGIYANLKTTIDTCNSSYNKTLINESSSIYALEGATIYNSVAGNNINTNHPTVNNNGVGFQIRSGIIKNCIAMYNSGDGILTERSSKIEENMCRINGNNGIGAGIHASEYANYIKNNSIINNDIGIDIDGIANTTIQNFISDNTLDTSIVAGNDTATITNNADNANIWNNFTF